MKVVHVESPKHISIQITRTLKTKNNSAAKRPNITTHGKDHFVRREKKKQYGRLIFNTRDAYGLYSRPYNCVDNFIHGRPKQAC